MSIGSGSGSKTLLQSHHLDDCRYRHTHAHAHFLTTRTRTHNVQLYSYGFCDITYYGVEMSTQHQIERKKKKTGLWRCCHCCFTGWSIRIYLDVFMQYLFACRYKIGNHKLSNCFCSRSRFFNLITNSSAINYSGQRNMHPTRCWCECICVYMCEWLK